MNEKQQAMNLMGLNYKEPFSQDFDDDAYSWLTNGDIYDFDIDKTPSNDNYMTFNRTNLTNNQKEKFGYDKNTKNLYFHPDASGPARQIDKRNFDFEYHGPVKTTAEKNAEYALNHAKEKQNLG